MVFEKGQLYHIYNQGNNRQRIFFRRENYLFFLGKAKRHIAPFADVLAWCLMPNHFHFMVYVNTVELPMAGWSDGWSDGRGDGRGATSSRTPTTTTSIIPSSSSSSSIRSATESRTLNQVAPKLQTIQQSIGIMLASYTRAINNQQKSSGSLFRSKTKAIPLCNSDRHTPAWFISEGITQINSTPPEKQYPNICFNYIMFNPIKDGIVKRAEDWEFTSYHDLIGRRDGKLISRERILELGLTIAD